MRHLAVAEPCPIDRRAVGRRTCSSCSHFVSFRSTDAVDTVGCSWGEDTIAWLRREMAAPPPAAPARTGAAPGAGRTMTARADGAALAVVAAAVGLGLLLSAFNRRPTPRPGGGLAI